MAIDETRTSIDSQDRPICVHAVFWNALGPGSVAYTVTQLLDNLPEGRVERTLWCLACDPNDDRDYCRPALPSLAFRALCKLGVPAAAQGRLANLAVLGTLLPGDILYVWPPFDLRLIRKASKRGAIVVAERINCMGDLVREVLSDAFARSGRRLPEGWCTSEAITEDREQMHACDFVTAPNARVADSARMAGIPDERILETSYGYSPERLAAAIGIERPERAPVFAFVGLGNVRKGLDVVLEAWELAAIGGTLLIAGRIDEDLRAQYQHALSREDVHELGHVDDIATVYAAADVFVFPSHEEGGPQVTYEAAACGLALIVSSMGAGRVARDGQECLMIDPLSVTDLAAAISKLARDRGLLRTLGANAAARALEFRWAEVGMRLYKQFDRIARLRRASRQG